MTELAQCERELMEVFRHFRCTGGHMVSAANVLAARTQHRSSPDHDKALNAIIQSLVEKGLVTVEPDQVSLRLTAKGDLYLYGEDDEPGGLTDCDREDFPDDLDVPERNPTGQ